MAESNYWFSLNHQDTSEPNFPIVPDHWFGACEPDLFQLNLDQDSLHPHGYAAYGTKQELV